MIDLFVNKVILYDDYFDIVFNASEDNTQNIKLENIEDAPNLENQLNNKKEQPEHYGSDCFSMVQKMGFEPTQYCYHKHLKLARLPFRHFCTSLMLGDY